MKNTLLTLSLIACAILALLTKQGCNANKGMEAALAKSKVEDSIHIRTMDSLTDAANAITVEMGQRDIEYNRTIDSLEQAIAATKTDLRFKDVRIENLITTIHEYGTKTGDKEIVDQADTLQAMYDNAKENVIYLLDAYNTKDSLFTGNIVYKDSVIVALNGIITAQQKTFDAQQQVIINLQGELEKAIKAGKKKAVIRNLIDGILIALLIIKK